MCAVYAQFCVRTMYRFCSSTFHLSFLRQILLLKLNLEQPFSRSYYLYLPCSRNVLSNHLHFRRVPWILDLDPHIYLPSTLIYLAVFPASQVFSTMVEKLYKCVTAKPRNICCRPQIFFFFMTFSTFWFGRC